MPMVVKLRFDAQVSIRWFRTAADAAVYVVLAATSLSTDYVASNTAALWMPTGFSIGLLVCRGLQAWPAVLIGAFLVNLGTNVLLPPSLPLGYDIGAALAVSVGNALEALAGSWLIIRYCRGTAFLEKARSVIGMALAALVAPLPSAIIGGVGSLVAGLTSPSRLPEMMWTWYTADAAGMIIFTAPTVLLLSRMSSAPFPKLRLEAVLLALALLFLCQAISGLYLAPWIADLPRLYMLVPLLIWASIRFGTKGAVLATLGVALMALLGTVRGYQAFPARTPSASLLELQIFLSLLSTLNLYAAASRREVEMLQADLRDKLSTRTLEVEKLLDDRDIRFGLLAHEMKGPVNSIRMVLKGLGGAIESGSAQRGEIRDIIHGLEDASSNLLSQVHGTLTDIERKIGGAASVGHVMDMVLRRIARRRGEAAAASIRLSFTDGDIVENASLVTLILGALIDNALTHGTSECGVDVRVVTETVGLLSFEVRDYGAGVPAEHAARLLQQVMRTSDAPQATGMGLLLAGRIARSLGGDVRSVAVSGRGTMIRLEMPITTAHARISSVSRLSLRRFFSN